MFDTFKKNNYENISFFQTYTEPKKEPEPIVKNDISSEITNSNSVLIGGGLVDERPIITDQNSNSILIGGGLTDQRPTDISGEYAPFVSINGDTNPPNLPYAVKEDGTIVYFELANKTDPLKDVIPYSSNPGPSDLDLVQENSTQTRNLATLLDASSVMINNTSYNKTIDGLNLSENTLNFKTLKDCSKNLPEYTILDNYYEFLDLTFCNIISFTWFYSWKTVYNLDQESILYEMVVFNLDTNSFIFPDGILNKDNILEKQSNLFPDLFLETIAKDDYYFPSHNHNLTGRHLTSPLTFKDLSFLYSEWTLDITTFKNTKVKSKVYKYADLVKNVPNGTKCYPLRRIWYFGWISKMESNVLQLSSKLSYDKSGATYTDLVYVVKDGKLVTDVIDPFSGTKLLKEYDFYEYELLLSNIRAENEQVIEFPKEIKEDLNTDPNALVVYDETSKTAVVTSSSSSNSLISSQSAVSQVTDDHIIKTIITKADEQLEINALAITKDLIWDSVTIHPSQEFYVHLWFEDNTIYWTYKGVDHYRVLMKDLLSTNIPTGTVWNIKVFHWYYRWNTIYGETKTLQDLIDYWFVIDSTYKEAFSIKELFSNKDNFGFTYFGSLLRIFDLPASFLEILWAPEYWNFRLSDDGNFSMTFDYNWTIFEIRTKNNTVAIETDKTKVSMERVYNSKTFYDFSSNLKKQEPLPLVNQTGEYTVTLDSKSVRNLEELNTKIDSLSIGLDDVKKQFYIKNK